jgi:ribosomal protein S18 acetylase RimI-like enzyme
VPSEIEIRPVTDVADLRALAPLFDAYRVFYEEPSDVEASYRFLLERLQQRDTVLYLASIVGDVVGFVHLFPSFHSAKLRHFWILNDLFVVPAYRRLGVARALMQRAEAHAIRTGAIGLTLSTATDNNRAQKLYDLAGYERDDEFYVYNRYFSE